ncbi:hypothetical protein [Desulfacinum infernum]|nr:hypothetical protein [Desulfacinum infernum]
MEIKVNLELSSEDIKELSRILGCGEDELSVTLSPYAAAAVEELVTMFLGQKVFTRGTDIREWRLYLLIKHAFSSRIPDEQEVCKLFQTTTSGSRALLRAVMSKYQYLLKDGIERTLQELLNRVEVADDGDELMVAIHNLNLVEELNRVLAELDSSLPPVEKKRGSVSTYRLRRSSYLKLCERFGITSKIDGANNE